MLKKIGDHLKADWYKYLLEIIVVILGILIAYNLDQWQEERNRTRLEVKILREFKTALSTDLADVRENIALQERGTRSCKIILRVIADKLPNNDSLDAHFAYTHTASYFINNTSPYDQLKIGGLDIISNDAIRNRIENVYGRTYYFIRQLESEVHRKSELLGTVDMHYLSNVSRVSGQFRVQALDFTGLMSNSEYPGLLRSVISGNTVILELAYYDASNEIDELIRLINDEIDELEG
jgi:hypothetical protein